MMRIYPLLICIYSKCLDLCVGHENRIHIYKKLNGTALTHALKSDTQFSLMFITLHDGMSHGFCKCPLLCLCWCLLLVHQPLENLSLIMCWQYKWQHGSSSTGGGFRGRFGLSNGVRRLSDDWQEELKVVKLFSL